uniref:Restriction system protein Mrr-like N-terminal domain-containing protein n=1 Tax=Schlesneria paludicola TaxID=360056 RepID=A0A7C4LJS2_9PLAN
MIENNPTSVVAAFEMLLEEIEAEIDLVNRAGARAFEDRDYDKAKEALERAAQISGFRDKADALRREWGNLFGRENDEEGSESHAERRNLGRLRRGLRTREQAYYRPILEALQALGGSAPIHQVLDRVLESMKPVLKDVDYEPLASEPDMPRWKNAAQWARTAMVKEGLLRSDSPRGTWQISEAGVRFLQGEGGG